MMYAVINIDTGVIRLLSHSYEECLEEVEFLNSIDDFCVLVKVPRLMLDQFGQELLLQGLPAEEVLE